MAFELSALAPIFVPKSIKNPPAPAPAPAAPAPAPAPASAPDAHTIPISYLKSMERYLAELDKKPPDNK